MDQAGITRRQVQRGRTEFGETYNWSEYRSVVNRAISAWNAAGQYGPGDDTGPGENVPIDPTIRPGEGQYHYRVVVEVTEGARVLDSTAVSVYSNMPLTHGEISDIAFDIATAQRPGRDYPNAILNLVQGGGEVATYTIAAGRAS